MSQPASVIALVSDLMFSSKIIAEARAAGTQCKIVRDPARLPALDSGDFSVFLVDLNMPGAIAPAAKWSAERQIPAVGFVSHVDADTIQKAREAGITRILARGRFVQILPHLLRGGEMDSENTNLSSEDVP